jgi:hypothetical protein
VSTTTTSFDLSPGSRTWGKCTVSNISGQRALGFYRLLFTLGVDIHPFSEGIQYRLTGFAGDLFVQGRLLGSFSVSQQSFPLEPQAGYVSPRSLNFFIDLDRARLEAL